MHLQLKAWRRSGMNAQSLSLVIPWQSYDPVKGKITVRGHARFTKIGDVVEVPDSAAHGILKTHGDMLQQVVLEKKTPSHKRAVSPSNK